jgi:hypothetical protein
MPFSRPIQWYHSHAGPIWPDGTFKSGEGIWKGRSEAEREFGSREVEGGRVDRGREAERGQSIGERGWVGAKIYRDYPPRPPSL